MARKKKIKWNMGAVFAVPLEDGSFGYGQAVDLMMPNVVYCTFFDIHTPDIPSVPPVITQENAISCVAVTREQLDYGVWKVIGNVDPVFRKNTFKNEKYASGGYVGAKIHDAALAEDFLSSFYRMLPWDDWYDPNYLDEFLLSPKLKPSNLKYKKT